RSTGDPDTPIQMTPFRIALVQMNSWVGAIEANANRIIESIGRAREQGADMVVFPELAVTGYPPEDLLLKPRFLQANVEALKRIQEATHGLTAVVGFVDVGHDISNAAAVLHNGSMVGLHRKIYLPNYGV